VRGRKKVMRWGYIDKCISCMSVVLLKQNPPCFLRLSVLLEESSFVCFIIYGYFDVRVLGNYPRRRARLDTLEPRIAVVLLICTQVMVLAWPRGSVNTPRRWSFALVAVTPAKQAGGLTAALEKIREGAARLGLDMQHAPNGWPRLARQEEEDGFCAADAAAVGRH